MPTIARAALHFGEEPCISGTRGSGAIFFTGCSLRCVFCQNREISSNAEAGLSVTADRLREIMLKLQNMGAHNINLVTPTHFADQIAWALDGISLSVPVVYNSSGYESVDTLKLLKGKADIYMPDMKYSNDIAAGKYSSAPGYVETAKKAIYEMYDQVGSIVFDENGILQKGLIIRHLMLPGNIANTLGVIRWVAETFPKGSVLFSLMSQYTPVTSSSLPDELKRPVSLREYKRATELLLDVGLTDGYVQELSSSDKSYIPAFDLTGVI